MGVEVGVFSGDARKEKDSNRSSSDSDAILLSSPVDNAFYGRPHTSRETSHLLSACSSHGSFSENEESGETLRDSNSSADIQMISKPTISQADENCGSLKATIFPDNCVSSQPEKQRESECTGDGIPCVSGSDFMKMKVDGHKGDTYGKILSCCSSSDNSFSEVEKVINDQPSSSCLSGTPFGNADAKNLRLNSFTKDSLQEILCCSKPSDLSEISSIRDSCAGTSSQKGERSECSEEQVQSSFARETTLKIGSLMGDEHSTTGSLRVDNGNRREQSAEAATCSNKREQSAEAATYSNKREQSVLHFRTSPTVVKEAGKGGTIVGSVPADCGDGSGITEYDVKVCDICGDVGKEESLAICSKCSDGAEHIYCMQVKLDKVPKGDWMCEECTLSEETEKQQRVKTDRGVGPLKKLSSNEIRQNSQGSNAFHFRNTLQSDVQGSAFEKIRTHKVSSSRPSSAKIPTGSVEAISVRKRPFETIAKLPNKLSHSRKTLRGQPSGTDMETAQIPSTSVGKSPTMPLQSQMSKGFLSKSKSFPSTSVKEKVQPSREGSGLKQDFARKTVKNGSKEGVTKMMLKSLSFNNALPNGQKNTSLEFKKFPSQFSSGGYLKRLRHANKQSLTKIKMTLSSAVNNPAALKVGEKITAHGKTSLPEVCRSNYQDLPGDKSHLRSSSSLEPSGQLAKRGFPTQERKGSVNDVRQPVDFVEVVSANNANHSKVAVHSDERACQRDTSLFAPLKDVTPQVYAIPEPGDIWKGKFEISRGSKLSINCDGIQAHLSSLASHKVLEVAKKLPPELLLAKVTRSSMWPTQFVKSQAREDNIALYFFPKDLASYNRSYKTLVDSMIKNDFCLKGNFGGFDLLIFSSNLLPEKAQRWNKLLFLWGVFRGKKIICSDKLPSQKPCTSSLKEEQLNHGTITPSISASRNLFSSGQSSESFSDNAQQLLSPTTSMNIQADTSGRMVEVCKTEVSPAEQKFMDLQTTTDQQLDLVDTQKKIELSGDLPLSDSAQRAESNSKKRYEIDLNLSFEENEDSLKMEDEHLCKRLKPSIGGMGESNIFRDVNNSSYRFCSLTDGQGPHISDGLHKSDEANNMSISPASLDLGVNQSTFGSMLQQQVLSRQNEHQLQAVIPDLDLSLGLPKQENIRANEPEVSLTLSLALPSTSNPLWK
ncbi:hypothetical protein SLE2022_091110 [Rubroshorea leprosula]